MICFLLFPSSDIAGHCYRISRCWSRTYHTWFKMVWIFAKFLWIFVRQLCASFEANYRTYSVYIFPNVISICLFVYAFTFINLLHKIHIHLKYSFLNLFFFFFTSPSASRCTSMGVIQSEVRYIDSLFSITFLLIFTLLIVLIFAICLYEMNFSNTLNNEYLSVIPPKVH